MYTITKSQITVLFSCYLFLASCTGSAYKSSQNQAFATSENKTAHLMAEKSISPDQTTPINGNKKESPDTIQVVLNAQQNRISSPNTEITQKKLDPAILTTGQMMSVTRQLLIPVQQMLQKMHSLALTNDIDQNFAHILILHHQAAIEMSEILVQSGQDSKLHKLAQKSVTRQSIEVVQLQNFLQKQADPHSTYRTQKGTSDVITTADTYYRQLLIIRLADKMIQLKKKTFTGNAEVDYTQLITQHKQEAIELANMEMQYGKDPELKKLAQNIIQDQTIEKSVLDLWLTTTSKK